MVNEFSEFDSGSEREEMDGPVEGSVTFAHTVKEDGVTTKVEVSTDNYDIGCYELVELFENFLKGIGYSNQSIRQSLQKYEDPT